MKKVLSLVLVLSMVLGSFSFAFAAPADVAGTEYEEAVARLGQLKVLEGYPDGTFKPENTITRAEFAAVVVRARGLDSAAKASVGGTTFKDVPAGNWAAGYVNIASKTGLVQGMGDGTFAPNSPVTYEQAVTMVMRALGYEQAALARGGYPYGHLIIASETGLLDSVKGTQGVPAPRGLVAQLVDNALEIAKMIQVGYGTQTKWVVSGTEDTKEEYLLDDLGFDNIVGRVVKVDASKEKITVKNDDVTKTLDVKEGFDFEEAEGLRVKAWYASNEVELLKLLDTPKFDAVKPADKKVKLVAENKNYSLAKDAILVVNNEEVEQEDFTADYAKVAFDKDGDIVWAKGYTFDDNIVVEKVDEYVVESFGYDELDLEDYTIVKDGKTIAVEDLEEADVVFYNEDEAFAVVANIVKENKIDRVYTDSFKFDGKVYNINEAKYLDGDKLGALTYDVLNEMQDSEEEVTVYFNFAGGANGVVLVAGTREIEETNSSYFLVTKTTDDFAKRNSTYWTLDVLNSEGKEVAYDVTDKFVTDFNEDAKAGEKWSNVVVAGNIIEIKLDKDGDVESVAKLEKVGRYTDKFKVTASYVKGWKLQPSTVVFRNDNASSLAKHSVITLEKAEEKFGNILEYDLYLTSNGRVAAIYADKTDAKSDTTSYVGLVTSIKKLTGTAEKADVTIYVQGEKNVYTTTQKLVKDNNVKVDDIVKISVGNKTKEIEGFDNELKTATVTVDKVSVGERTINGKYELIDKAVIYDAGDDYSELKLRDLEKGDKVTVYFNGDSTRFVNYVVKDEVAKADPEKESNFGGAYTVKGQVWVTIDGKDFLYGGDETATQLNNLYTDKVVKVTTKTVDGYQVVTKIEIVKDADPTDPGTDPEPEEITAEAKVDYVAIVRKHFVKVSLSDSTKLDKVEKFVIGTTEYEVEKVENGYVYAKATFDNAPTSVKVVVEGKTITATIK